ncbi:hypothetical protein MASR1M101_39850 [Gemmatimonas sp.]
MGSPRALFTTPRTVPVPGMVGEPWAGKGTGAKSRNPSTVNSGMKREYVGGTRMFEALKARTCVGAQVGYDES